MMACLFAVLPGSLASRAAEPVGKSDDVVLLEDFESAQHGDQAEHWSFYNGGEFPGATGKFSREKEATGNQGSVGKLSFDFTGGGAYVTAIRKLDHVPAIRAIRLKILKPRGVKTTFRYVDASGQTVQKSFDATFDRWTDVRIPMSDWTNHWGGKNDGVVRGPPVEIAIIAENSGPTTGKVWFDDIRLEKGEAGSESDWAVSEYEAFNFSADEAWRAEVEGPAGNTKRDGNRWQFDFTKDAKWMSFRAPAASLIGEPQEISVRFRGKVDHAVKLEMSSHFQNWQKWFPAPTGDGEHELRTATPPGEGWHPFGGENDNKLHGPLRFNGVYLEAGPKDSGTVEMVSVRVKTRYMANHAILATIERKDGATPPTFTATIRNISGTPIESRLSWTLRDWSGKTIAAEETPLTLPADGKAVRTEYTAPAGTYVFLEADLQVLADGQFVAPVQACFTAPIDAKSDDKLEPDSPWGMGVYLCRYLWDPAGIQGMERAAAMAQAAGVKWTREDFSWSHLEPAKEQYDWTYYDNLVATAKKHGISVCGLLVYWSNWTKPYTPEGIDDYCRFAAACAKRYRDDVTYWEIWNEPNIFFWAGDKDLYAQLLTKANAAIKEANPNAIVLGCSTSEIDQKFIARTIELGGEFDVLTVHPYRARLIDQKLIEELQHAAKLVQRPDGTKRPMWITEIGWSSALPMNDPNAEYWTTNEREQAQHLARAYLDSLAGGVVSKISWYDFRDDGADLYYNEQNFGIITHDFQPKPAYRAYATMNGLLRGKTFAANVDAGSNVRALRFDGKVGKSVVALWSTNGAQRATLTMDGTARVIDLIGSEITAKSIDGKMSLDLSANSPVFVTRQE